MPDVFESRFLPELLETEVEADQLEHAVMIMGDFEEDGEEDESWDVGRQEWEDEDDSEFDDDALDEVPDFLVDEVRYRLFLTLVERLKMEFPVAVSLQDVGVQDLDRLLQEEDEGEYDFGVLDDAVELVRVGIFTRVVKKYLGPDEADLDLDLVGEAVQSDIGMDMICGFGSSSTGDIVRAYLVSRSDGYFEALSGESEVQE